MRTKNWLVALSAMTQLGCGILFCIARGSKVKTPRGERFIEELQVGDEVIVVDPQSLEEHVGKISAVKSAKRECSLINSLRLTSSHPLYDTDTNEWAPAGDWLLGLRSHYATVNGPAKATHVERFVGIDDVFDLTVEHPLHTIVADGVVVHNKSVPKRIECRLADGTLVTNKAPCACGSARGEVMCSSRGFSVCSCDTSRERWPSAYGLDDSAVADFDRWEVFGCNNGSNGALFVVDDSGRPVPGASTPGVLVIQGSCGFARAIPGTPGAPFSVLFGGAQNVNAPFLGFNLQHQHRLSLYEFTNTDGGVQLSMSGTHAGEPVRFVAPVTLSTERWYRLDWTIEAEGEEVMAWPTVADYESGEVIGRSSFVMADGTSLADWYASGKRFVFPNDSRQIVVGSPDPGIVGQVFLK